MQHLIEPEQLVTELNKDNLVIVDLCNIALYQQKHVPGAIHIQAKPLVKGTPPVPGLCPDEKQLAQIINYLGLTHDKRIILYDDEGGGLLAAWRGAFDLMGFNNWCYLNGGIVPWIKEGFPTESSANQPASLDAQSHSITNPQVKISAEEINDSLGSADFAIWDARSPAEFTGSMVRAARADISPVPLISSGLH